MSTRKEIISSFYGHYDENGRTTRSRHGQLEFCTTMSYIHRYATRQSKILETDEEFKSFAEWYLAFSEKRELLGTTNHLLYICRKQA